MIVIDRGDITWDIGLIVVISPDIPWAFNLGHNS